MKQFRAAIWAVPVLLATIAAPLAQEGAMSPDEMKEVARKSIEMWSAASDIDPSAVFTEDYVNHQEPYADGGVRQIGVSRWAEIVAANHSAFPDLTVDILMQVGEGDKVATRWRFSGTQEGSYEGQAATGKAVSWTGVQIDRFADGKIAESWVNWDKFTMFSELGLID